MGSPRKAPIDIARVLATYAKLQQDDAVLAYLGSSLVGEAYQDFYRAIAALLPRAVPEAVQASVEYLVGRQLSEEALDDLLYRLAANQDLLRQGRPALPWREQTRDEWVPLQVMSVQRRQLRKRAGVVATVTVLAGTSCRHELEQFWSLKFCAGPVAIKLGFSRRHGKHPFHDPQQLVSMRMTGLIEAARSSRRPWFQQIAVPDRFLAWNKRLLQARHRTQPSQCPQGFAPLHLCHRCHVGQDACGLACHPRTYVQAVCEQCQTLAWVDPAWPEVCLHCREREEYQVHR